MICIISEIDAIEAHWHELQEEAEHEWLVEAAEALHKAQHPHRAALARLLSSIRHLGHKIPDDPRQN